MIYALFQNNASAAESVDILMMETIETFEPEKRHQGKKERRSADENIIDHFYLLAAENYAL
jgi:hypothetical protein